MEGYHRTGADCRTVVRKLPVVAHPRMVTVVRTGSSEWREVATTLAQPRERLDVYLNRHRVRDTFLCDS